MKGTKVILRKGKVMCKCKSPEELRMLTFTNEVMSIRDNLVGLRLDLGRVVNPHETLAFHEPDDLESQRELLDSVDILAHPEDHAFVLHTELENTLMYVEMLLEEAFLIEEV